VITVSPDALLTPTDVRGLTATLGLRPTKSLGQNFVVDPNTVRRIVRAAGVSPDDVVLEVGPGLGSLTLALLPQVGRVTAIEIDPVLACALPATVAARLPDRGDRLAVVHADALTVTAADFGTPTALVANLPYNVAVPVVLRLLDVVPSLTRGLVMVQAEVADRLTAPPGSRTYGAPSAKAAWWAQMRPAGRVSRSVFWPVPNVDSALVAFDRRAEPATSATRAEVFAVIDEAFGQRRKTLRSALSGWAGSASDAEAILRAAGVDPSARGEQLAIADFAAIASSGSAVRSGA